MRLHLPALIALVSSGTYVACGSSDPAKSVQEVGGAAGEGGMATSSGGKSSGAGTQSSGGSKNNAGESGMTTGGVSNAGAAGSDAAGAGGAAGSGGAAGQSGAAGAGGAGDPYALPAECPGIVGDYTLTLGTGAADEFTALQQAGQSLIFGLAGADVFDVDYEGHDCLLGGPGDDDFTSSGEGSSYFFGGPGDDVYHLINDYNYFYVADMESNDTITLSITAFDFLVGTAGGNLQADQIISLAGYSSGNASIPATGNPGAIVYDPDNGQLWADTDRGDKTTGAKQIGTIMNYSTYTFDTSDFRLDD